MSSRCLSLLLFAASSLVAADGRVLRVCADPNNMPFSNQAGEGLENRIAQLVARDLHADLQYTWYAERRSFLKYSLQADLCDVVMGVPSTLDTVATTAPYYRSTYAFVEKAGRPNPILSLTDPRLAQMRIGIHQVVEDFAPPAHLLARQGLSKHLVG